MKTTKEIGIWMDHANAHITDRSTEQIATRSIESKFTHEVREQSHSKSEGLEQNKEQHQQADYYKQLGAVIINYDHALLFGPTDAKTELYNLLKADHHFDKIKIDVKTADKMTENQQHAFVKTHFDGHHTE